MILDSYQALRCFALAGCLAFALETPGRTAGDGSSNLAELQLGFDQAGLKSIEFDKVNYLAKGAPAVTSIELHNGAAVARTLTPSVPTTSSFDRENSKALQEFDWGTINYSYAIQGNRLDFVVEVTNKSASETITSLKIDLASLALPDTSANENLSVNNISLFGASLIRAEKCSIAMGNWEVRNPVFLRLGRLADGGYPLQLIIPGALPSPHHLVDDPNLVFPNRSIGPGQKDSYHVSLSFGLPSTTLVKLCPEVLANVSQQRPMEIDWRDRRPIGALFLSNPNQRWPTNPRGYNFGKKAQEDVNTPQGREVFGKALLHLADQTVASIKGMNGQGVMVWDVEGQEMWQPISYLGDPRLLPKLSPEMDQFADAFFKKFLDAGLRTGICIRPTEVAWSDTSHHWDQREVSDPVQTISDKIDYAQRRWGCTLFYFDSSILPKRQYMTKDQAAQMSDIPDIFPLTMLEALHRKHPDVMIFPEETLAASSVAAMPYRGPQLRQYGTSQLTREVFPAAASLVNTEDLSLLDNWDVYLDNVVKGDILTFFDYPGTRSVLSIMALYQEAELRKQGVPETLRNARLEQALVLKNSPDARTRFFAAAALAGNSRPEACQALLDLLDDEEISVRKSALVALARTSSPRDSSNGDLAHKLVGIIHDTTRPSLAPFAADALGGLGRVAISPAKELLRDRDIQMQVYGLRVMGRLPEADPDTIEALTLETKSQRALIREKAAMVLGQLRVTGSVPLLIDMLDDKDEYVAMAATAALGKMPAESVQSALPPLVKLFDRRFATVVVYFYSKKLNEALQQITGENLPHGAVWWKQWLAQRTPPSGAKPG